MTALEDRLRTELPELVDMLSATAQPDQPDPMSPAVGFHDNSSAPHVSVRGDRVRRRSPVLAAVVTLSLSIAVIGVAVRNNQRGRSATEVVAANVDDTGTEIEASDGFPDSALPTQSSSTHLSTLWQLSDVAPSGGSTDILLSDSEHVFVAKTFDGPDVTAVSAATGDTVWSRAALSDSDSMFLKLVADGLVIGGEQHGPVVAVSADDGTTRWTVDLPERYGATSLVAFDSTVFVAVDASYEGDSRAPMVIAVDTATGAEKWRTDLSDGTDLQLATPVVASDVLVVQSTLSHPGSADGNVAHALAVTSGEIVWRVDLGGSQGFHYIPAVTDGRTVYLSGNYEQMVAVDRRSGDVLWQAPGVRPLGLDSSGYLIAESANEIIRIDPTSQLSVGDPILSDLDREAVLEPLAVNSLLVVPTSTRIIVIDTKSSSETGQWSSTLPTTITDVAAVGDRSVAVSTSDGGLTMISLTS